MSRFATQAARLAGLAGALLGWRPDEFWRATPAELAGILAVLNGEGGAADGMCQADLDRLMEAERHG
jgi:uncharacterized phage protein (TIGR02216 family)